MPTITFEPRPGHVSYGLALGDEPPEWAQLGAGCGLGWPIAVAREDKIRLTTGGTLSDIPGRAFVRVGTATPVGKARFGNGAKIAWGHLRHQEHAVYDDMVVDESFWVALYVSQPLFERLLDLARQGKLPSMSLEVCQGPPGESASDVEPLKYGWEPDGSGVDWDNKQHRLVEIDWCEFTYPLAGAESASEEETDPEEEARARAALPVTKSDLDAMRSEVSARFRSLIVAVWTIAILVAVFAFFR